MSTTRTSRKSGEGYIYYKDSTGFIIKMYIDVLSWRTRNNIFSDGLNQDTIEVSVNLKSSSYYYTITPYEALALKIIDRTIDTSKPNPLIDALMEEFGNG